MVLESIIHLVQNSHYLRNSEVNPIQLRRTLQFMPEECDYLIELHSEALIHVLFPCSFPGNFLFVLPVAEFKIVLDELPVHGSSCRCFYLILRRLSEQLCSIVLVQDVDDHCLSSTYDLVAVLQIGKVNRRIPLLELRIVLLLPFILRQKGVFLLLVGNQYVLHYHSHDLSLPPDRPINQCHLLLLGNILLLC